MPLVAIVPYSWQFWPPPYGPLRPIVGARPVRVLQTRALRDGGRDGLGWVNYAIQGGVIAVTAAIGHWKRSSERRNVATATVNEAEPWLIQNLEAYMGSAHTIADQSAALANFDEVWQAVKDACLVPRLGQAGRRCVSDRERTGQSPWPIWYRDPIANDPDVRAVEPAAPGAGAGELLVGWPWGGVAPGGAGLTFDWQLLAGVALVVGALVWKGA